MDLYNAILEIKILENKNSNTFLANLDSYRALRNKVR